MIHFAGRKYVNESVEEPLKYYQHNVLGTINLATAMKDHGCKNVRPGPWPGGAGRQVWAVQGCRQCGVCGRGAVAGPAASGQW